MGAHEFWSVDHHGPSVADFDPGLLCRQTCIFCGCVFNIFGRGVKSASDLWITETFLQRHKQHRIAHLTLKSKPCLQKSF